MKKNFLFFVLGAIVVLGMGSCENLKSFHQDDIVGDWVAEKSSTQAVTLKLHSDRAGWLEWWSKSSWGQWESNGNYVEGRGDQTNFNFIFSEYTGTLDISYGMAVGDLKSRSEQGEVVSVKDNMMRFRLRGETLTFYKGTITNGKIVYTSGGGGNSSSYGYAPEMVNGYTFKLNKGEQQFSLVFGLNNNADLTKCYALGGKINAAYYKQVSDVTAVITFNYQPVGDVTYQYTATLNFTSAYGGTVVFQNSMEGTTKGTFSMSK
jgi:hypothetical protein